MSGIARRALLGGALALPMTMRPGLARWVPAGKVTIVVPYASGGTNDEVMRALAEGMARRLGQPVEILNKPGRRGVRFIAGMVNTPPDGLLLAQLPAAAIRIALLENLPFDASRDTTPILSVAGSAFGSIAKVDRFPDGWAGFIREAREKPGALSYGTAGVNSTGHLTMARLLLRERVQAVHVPFRGAMHGVQALAAGDIDVMAGPAGIGEAVTNGEAVWLNVWSAERLRRWPDAPTLRELGYRLVVTSPFGIVGPPRLPAEITAAVHDAVLATMRDEPFLSLLERLDMTEDYRDGAAYAAFIAESARTEEMLIGRLGLVP
ncbi:tripartite tricarboxylate transporter substrate binding protein [Roseomonas sp. HJA6]|uniref:Tripartite tricarboxylate transporter substrate binding protein n=1 Tax=Roseomonas alba TaxID=2846776 RepID=A0ABS7AHU3_9PROT|nr:tripartite tricarboxylate transporter substrate binding protein [Neoroseomonas alba]MBW6401889.1 tripartite tricarboxylate transporter substrate binding protein [Neoroseomonas alba]